MKTTSDTGQPAVTHGAIDAYRNRVDGTLDSQSARAEIARITGSGPRSGPDRGKWSQYLRLDPGAMAIEDPLDPGVAVIVQNGVVKTVVTERFYMSSADLRDEEGGYE